MDKTTKFILGLIAVALIGINIQMWDGKLIKDAHAVASHNHYDYQILGFESEVKNIVENNCNAILNKDDDQLYIDC